MSHGGGAQEQLINVNFGYKERRAEFDRKNKFNTEEMKQELVDKLKVLSQ